MRCATRHLGLLLALAACGGPSPPEEQGGGSVMVEPHPDAMRASGWLEFKDLTLHLSSETGAPREPYVRGWILGGLFYPAGEVQGVLKELPSRRVLEPGWLELRTRGFTPAKSGQPRVAPYVEGYRDRDTRGFLPTSGIRGQASTGE